MEPRKKLDKAHRQGLREQEGRRDKYTGTFVRYGFKSGWRAPQRTMLLAKIMDASGTVVCDHLWFNLTKGFEALGELVGGEMIEFHARVTRYSKGHVDRRSIPGLTLDNRRDDFKLSHPTRIKLVDPN